MKGELLVDDKQIERKEKKSGEFGNASLLARFLIVLSGPLANVFLGILLISLIYNYNGRIDSKPVVGEVIQDSPAYNSGLVKNDIILKINEKNITDFNDLRNIVQKNANKKLVLKIMRSNEIVFLNIIPEAVFDTKQSVYVGRIGIKSGKMNLIKLDFFSSLYYSVHDTYTLTIEWVKGLYTLISLNAGKNDIAGPIGIAKISGDALSHGFFSIVFLMSLLSINLGLINLLPIPGLDGGYITLYILEFFRGKPLSHIIQMKLLKFGFFFLISLMIFVTLWDIKKLFI